MTRDEWVVLPCTGAKGDAFMVRRSSVIAFGRVYENGRPLEQTWFTLNGHAKDYNICALPLAEFEALLFAPAPSASDDYTRAAVRAAEGLAAWRCSTERGEPMEMNRPLQDAHAANVEAFLHLYRERHAPTEPEVAARVEHTGDTL